MNAREDCLNQGRRTPIAPSPIFGQEVAGIEDSTGENHTPRQNTARSSASTSENSEDKTEERMEKVAETHEGNEVRSRSNSENQNPGRIIAALHQGAVRLELSTTDLCFLTAMHLRETNGELTSLKDSTLVEVYEQVCELVEPSAENVGTRATYAIERLRKQRLLARIDGAGVVQAGEYNLTTLAMNIVQFFVEDEAEVLTRESLGLLTKHLIASLTNIQRHAEKAREPREWRGSVVEPLRVIVKELVSGIERRQRGLDQHQEEVRARMATMLEQQGFDAVDECEAVLNETAATLHELWTMLGQDAHRMQGLLQDIEQRADDAHAPEAQDAARTVMDRIDRVAAWGGARQQAWSTYYQHAHGHLRDFVRLDQSRALSERLHNQLTSWVDDQFVLVVSETAPMRVLREIEQHVERPAVTQAMRDREPKLDKSPIELDPINLEERVRISLAKPQTTLAGVLSDVLPKVAKERRYESIGQIAAYVAENAQPRGTRTRPWVKLSDDLEIEDWRLEEKRVQ